MAKHGNIFAQFQGVTEQKAKIKALDNAEITYRTLTMKESDDFQKRTIKGFDKDGKPEFNFDDLSELRYEKVALCLIEPKMTVKQLEQLSSSATKAIIEIEALISGMDDTEDIDKEGN